MHGDLTSEDQSECVQEGVWKKENTEETKYKVSEIESDGEGPCGSRKI